MELKVNINNEALTKLIELAARNKRSIPREAEVIILKSFGLWSEKDPSHLEVINVSISEDSNPPFQQP